MPVLHVCVWRGDCGDDVFHSGYVPLEIYAVQTLPWASPGMVQTPAKGVVDRELLLGDSSFFCELARRRKSQSDEPKPESSVMPRVKAGRLMWCELRASFRIPLQVTFAGLVMG